MYMVKLKVKKSKIHGKGTFALENIPKGTIVWLYEPSHDLSITQDEFEKLDDDEKRRFRHSAYLSPWTGLWICPPPGDEEYTNHSLKNNTTVYYDKKVSPEPYFVANRDIARGEEITNNYYEFDAITRKSNCI